MATRTASPVRSPALQIWQGFTTCVLEDTNTRKQFPRLPTSKAIGSRGAFGNLSATTIQLEAWGRGHGCWRSVVLFPPVTCLQHLTAGDPSREDGTLWWPWRLVLRGYLICFSQTSNSCRTGQTTGGGEVLLACKKRCMLHATWKADVCLIMRPSSSSQCLSLLYWCLLCVCESVFWWEFGHIFVQKHYWWEMSERWVWETPLPFIYSMGMWSLKWHYGGKAISSTGSSSSSWSTLTLASCHNTMLAEKKRPLLLREEWIL